FLPACARATGPKGPLFDHSLSRNWAVAIKKRPDSGNRGRFPGLLRACRGVRLQRREGIPGPVRSRRVAGGGFQSVPRRAETPRYAPLRISTRQKNRAPMSQQDWMLMHRVAAGDERAVAELYDRFGSLVYKVARQFLPSQAEAEDAVQE